MKFTISLCFCAAFIGALSAVAVTDYWGRAQASNSQQVQFAEPVIPPALPQTNPQGSKSPIAWAPLGPAVERSFSRDEQTNISVYETAKKAVVNIDTSTFVNVRWLGRVQEQENGSGSGWVLDKQGHIVTNYHVVAGSDLVKVTFDEGEAVTAEVIGINPRNDIAVLKVNVPADRLYPVKIGDSRTLRVGQKIFAIGNPFGLERTMTVGIVSSLDRSLKSKSGEQMRNIVQIDAALNQGNSGGPLLDSAGELVGMNTAIATLTGENTGVGFSVPARTILRVVPQLIQYGRFRTSWMGVDYFWKSDQGIGVAKVTRGGPADKAGLRGLKAERQVVRFGNQQFVVPQWIKESADIILKIDDVDVQRLDDLQAVVESKDPGDQITLTILREGRVIKVPLTLGDER